MYHLQPGHFVHWQKCDSDIERGGSGWDAVAPAATRELRAVSMRKGRSMAKLPGRFSWPRPDVFPLSWQHCVVNPSSQASVDSDSLQVLGPSSKPKSRVFMRSPLFSLLVAAVSAHRPTERSRLRKATTFASTSEYPYNNAIFQVVC